MKLVINPLEKDWSTLCQRPQLELEYLDTSVKNILARVKQGGDKALYELTKQFDKIALTNLCVTPGEIQEAVSQVPADLKEAIKVAAANITVFHEAQNKSNAKIETMPGVVCWQKSVAIEKVGIYIPGGTAPLFSTVLMLTIPATLAGCKEIILCTPPDTNGNINHAILYAASLAGITKIFKVGGAQAIAAMTYGTESISRVNKLFGPGNQFVTKAKQMVNQEGIAIDLPAGPSEVLVIADDSATPSFVAADLLSQAEHGEDSQVILVVSTETQYHSIRKELSILLEQIPRNEIARTALNNSVTIVLNDENKIPAFVNEYAPEHLIINTRNADELADQITNAGSVFLGNYSPEAVGDYASGTNHTLPTNGFAKAYSGVTLESFRKSITYQKLTEEGIRNIGPSVEKMATAEQLAGHKMAVSLRLQSLDKAK
jgi:histidinol dehydrogenase